MAVTAHKDDKTKKPTELHEKGGGKGVASKKGFTPPKTPIELVKKGKKHKKPAK